MTFKEFRRINLMKKEINELNQILKKEPYWIAFKEKKCYSYDGQSFIEVSFSFDLDFESEFDYLFVEDGALLYKFIKDNKDEFVQDGNSLRSGENLFPLQFCKFPPDFLKESESLKSRGSGLKLSHHDLKLFKGEELVCEKPLINDIISVIKGNRKETDNSFLFMEIHDGKVSIYESKTDFTLLGTCLIAVNKFFALKTKKKDSIEFLDFILDKNLIVVNYGNSALNLKYTFHVLDIGNNTRGE